MTRPDPLAAHARRLGNHDLHELLVQLPKPTFAALVDVALARPLLPAGLLLRYERPPVWMAGRWWLVPRVGRLGTLTRDRDPNGQRRRAWTRTGDPVQLAGVSCWRRRLDAGAALAWVTPASQARAWPWPPTSAAWPAPSSSTFCRAAPGGIRPAAGCGLRVRRDGRMTAVKRCSRCGQVKPAGEFYRRRRTRLSSSCRSCQLAAVRPARRRRRQDPAAADELRAVDRTRQRRHRALGGQDPSGGDAA